MAAALPMTYGRDNYNGTVRERSGWLLPAAVFVVTATLSALLLAYYLAPRPSLLIGQHPAPTARTDRITAAIHGEKFVIPMNYTTYGRERAGGERPDIALWAIYPGFEGYSEARAADFLSNSADSPVIDMLIHDVPYDITEAARLKRIYLNYVVDPAGKPGPFGLTEYTFRDDSGYRHEDLFAGETKDGLVLMRCVRLSQEVPSPSCLRDERLGRHVALSYRFKRTHLADWRAIAEGVDKLIAGFRKGQN